MARDKVEFLGEGAANVDCVLLARERATSDHWQYQKPGGAQDQRRKPGGKYNSCRVSTAKNGPLEGIPDFKVAPSMLRSRTTTGNFLRNRRGMGRMQDAQERAAGGRGIKVNGRSAEVLLCKKVREENVSHQQRRSSPETQALPLANLEVYLKERGPSTLVKESLGFSPSSARPRALPPRNQPVAYKCLSNYAASESRSTTSYKGKVLVRRRYNYDCANAADRDDLDGDDVDTDASSSERSAGCGMPKLHACKFNAGCSQCMGCCNKLDVLQRSSAECCFSANETCDGVKWRNRRSSWKHSSERSISSFGSDIETIPLMTEPEPFHDYNSDDMASCSNMDVGSGFLQEISHQASCRSTTRFTAGALTTSSPVQEEGTGSLKREKDGRGKQYRSLSQKYRPKSFKDLIGQDMVAESLSNAILRSKIAPVYLFCGPRGTGKTSAARIFTNAMNCLSIEELRPCGLCKECIAFHAGHNYDARQIDASGNNDAESVKLLLQHLSVPPSTSRYKVFIIDKCHLLATEAWNALLKRLEEPPSFVVFILITTDLEQLPRTAVSRCQKFMFPRIKDADIVLRLRNLALLEKVEIELKALQFIASKSDGSFRDAENMLDQLSLLGSNKVTLETVQEMVGLIPDDKLVKLLEVAMSGNSSSTINAIKELMESGVEPLALTSQLAALITDILAGENRVSLNNMAMALKVKEEEEEQERLKQVLMVLCEAEKQLRCCSDRMTWLTAAFLQLGPKDQPCLLPSSSRGTSATSQSPTISLAGTGSAARAILDPNSTTHALSYRDNEKPDVCSGSKNDRAGSFNVEGAGKLDSGPQKQTHKYSPCPFGDNKIHPFDVSSQCSSTPIQERQAGGGIYASPSPGVEEAMAQKDGSSMSPCAMDSIWRKVLQRSHSNNLKKLLEGEGRLVSLSVTEALAVAYVEFGGPEYKSAAERARPKIAHAFQLVLGCPVDVEIGLSCPPPINVQPLRMEKDKMSFSVQQSGECNRRRRISKLGRSLTKSSISCTRNLAFVESNPINTSLQYKNSGQSFEMGESQAITDRYTCTSGQLFSNFASHEHQDTMDGSEVERLGTPISQHVKQGSWKTLAGILDQDSQVPDRTMRERAEGNIDIVGNATAVAYDDGSCSELEGLCDRNAHSVLCWKRVKPASFKQQQQQRRNQMRRRKGRLLMRLLPCANAQGAGRFKRAPYI